MVTAYVLIQTTIGAQERVADRLATVPGVDHIAVVAGPYDVVARIGAGDIDALGRLVHEKIQSLAGISRTLTCTVVHL